MPESKAIPDWVNETPRLEYSLIVHGCEGDFEERVEMSRKEYVWLKKKLARRRGYLPPKPDPAAVPEDAASIFERGRNLAQS